jgi:hypothetical protein
MLAHATPTLVIALLIAASAAHADVYQCIGAGGKMLLTDSACPPGYRTNLMVSEPQTGASEAVAAAPQSAPATPPASSEAAAAAERKRLQAETEADRLRDQLELERERSALTRERLEAMEDRLDELSDWPVVYGGLAVPLVGAPKGRHHKFHDKDFKPKDKDGRVRRDGDARFDAKRRSAPRDARRDCGIFGCTPTITHAPWDDTRRGSRRRIP